MNGRTQSRTEKQMVFPTVVWGDCTPSPDFPKRLRAIYAVAFAKHQELEQVRKESEVNHEHDE